MQAYLNQISLSQYLLHPSQVMCLPTGERKHKRKKRQEMWSNYTIQDHLGPRNLQDPLGNPCPHIPQGGLWNLGCPEKK